MQAPKGLAAMLAAKPKPKPLPGYPVRKGLDEPTQWGGLKKAGWDPTTLPGMPKPPRPPKKPKPGATLALVLGRR